MKILSIFLLSLAISLVGAQGFDSFEMQRKMLLSPGMLLSNGDVKKELKLEKEQDKKISAVTKEQQKKLGEMSKGGRGSDPSGGMNMLTEMAKINAQAEADVLAVLTPEQKRRLRQIQWQALEGKSLFEEDIQKELALTEDQIGKINEFKADHSQRSTDVLMKQRGSGMKDAMKKLREEANKTLIELLTPEQAAKYKEAHGPVAKIAKRFADMIM